MPLWSSPEAQAPGLARRGREHSWKTGRRHQGKKEQRKDEKKVVMLIIITMCIEESVY